MRRRELSVLLVAAGLTSRVSALFIRRLTFSYTHTNGDTQRELSGDVRKIRSVSPRTEKKEKKMESVSLNTVTGF